MNSTAVLSFDAEMYRPRQIQVAIKTMAAGIMAAKATTSAKRASKRLAVRPSSAPVAQRAQHNTRLMQELDFINVPTPLSDAAVTD